MDSSEQVVTPDPATIKGLDAWRSLPIKQQPQWGDSRALEQVTGELSTVPPL
ncbi:MAG TPA: 3-deoxy-7-phosphoheptulonate synthase class II, partial [Microbacteriaceae bacterium]|nr:3-deoxy-7-phosphoheptulonate synthase class II [Microbacteriaceae bacterium]